MYSMGWSYGPMGYMGSYLGLFRFGCGCSWMIPGRFRDVITKRTVYANNAGTNSGEIWMSTEPVDIKKCEAIEQESEIHRC